MKLAVYITHGLTPAVTSKAVMVSTGGVPNWLLPVPGSGRRDDHDARL